MSNKFIFPIAYSIGVICGILSTRKYFKDKYEAIAQEEIASVKEVQNRRRNTEEQEHKREEYVTILQDAGYVPKENDDEKIKKEDIPYVIRPEEFMSNEDYDHITLLYHADGTLADEDGNVIENVEKTVGKDALNHFGEFEDDSVYVRNDELHCDYEILKDVRNFKYMPYVDNKEF